jgi:hypothetical protein
MTQRAHDFQARQPKDTAVLCLYAFVFNGEHELRSILDRLSEDDRAPVRHLAATFYETLVQLENER